MQLLMKVQLTCAEDGRVLAENMHLIRASNGYRWMNDLPIITDGEKIYGYEITMKGMPLTTQELEKLKREGKL